MKEDIRVGPLKNNELIVSRALLASRPKKGSKFKSSPPELAKWFSKDRSHTPPLRQEVVD